MVSHETSLKLEVRDISKQFGQVEVLHHISLNVMLGEVVSLLGASGSGKSTLLRCIAGLESVNSGTIVLDGTDITGLPTHQRGIGMMFQQFALFPHQTVIENIAFGLRMRGDSRTVQQQRVEELLALIGLQGYGPRTIFELSGGEQQRVALARSLAPNPRLLLLDEPLSALDQSLRERLMNDLRTIIKQIGVTALYVTHSQEEAFAVSDRIVVLEKGRMIQEGMPEQLYAHPANRFVATFLGIQNIIPVHTTAQNEIKNQWEVVTPIATLKFQDKNEPQPYIVIRSEKVEIVDNVIVAVENSDNMLIGVVTERSFRGRYYEVQVEYEDGSRLIWEVQKAPTIGEKIVVRVPPTAISFVAP